MSGAASGRRPIGPTSSPAPSATSWRTPSSCARRARRASVPHRRHADLRRFRPRAQKRELPRPVGSASRPDRGARSPQRGHQRDDRRRRQRTRRTSTAATTHDVELLVLPLSHRGHTKARVLGALGAARRALLARRLHARQPDARHAALSRTRREPAASIAPAPGGPRAGIRHGFIVYDGGQT